MDTHDAKMEVAAPRMNSPDRSRIDPNPKRIDELIPPDHKARLVWELVQGLDLTPLYNRIKAIEGHAGRPAIDPRILVSLWIYATDEGIASARELHRRCYDCDPYKWICGGVDVNYHTLSDFRTDHGQWLRDIVIENIATMRAEGLVALTTLGQDGMRVRASAGNDSFKKAETLERLLEEAEQQWDRLQKEFEQSERSPRQEAAQQRAAQEWIERLRQAQEEVKHVAEQREKRKKGDGASARASTTDPEARRMKMGDGGFRPAYNVEFTTDLDSLMIVGVDVVNAGSDAGQLEPAVKRLETEQEPLPAGAECYADCPFATQEDLESVGQRGVTIYAPVKEEERQRKEGKDPYAPKRGDTPYVAAWRQRMGTQEAKDKYKQRGKTEWPNAECRNRGLSQFLVRGLEKVKAVILWYVLTHNLFRMVALRAEGAKMAA
ncbi:MAG: IS1182 family transposase [Thermoguttaceae bacterium]|jgi:transposase|nr:IS1182 family transposase [Thermoguttaceae bacterium]